MQEDITPTTAKPTVDDVLKVQPQPAVQSTAQVAKQPVMDIKKPDTPDQKPQNSKDKKSEQPKKVSKNKTSSNFGIIFVACLICASLVGLAIYIQLQQQQT